MTTFKTRAEDRDMVTKILEASKEPMQIHQIESKSGLSRFDIRKCIGVLRVAGKIYNASTANDPRYMMCKNKPKPAERELRVTNSTSRSMLVLSPMHSDRPGAMDYQSISSLVAGKRVPYRVCSEIAQKGTT